MIIAQINDKTKEAFSIPVMKKKKSVWTGRNIRKQDSF
jgi:hypothetical protein